MAITIRMNQPSAGIPLQRQQYSGIPIGGGIDDEEKKRRQQALRVMAQQQGQIRVASPMDEFNSRLTTAMQRAREAGHSEDEVQRAAMIEQVREGMRQSQMQQASSSQSAQPEQPKKKTGRGGFLTSLISEGGATAGAAGGAAIGTAILPGIGTLIGAGLGGLAGGFGGRLAENKVRDDRWGVKDAAIEGAISGATSAIPFGALFQGGKQIVKGAGVAAAKQAVAEGVADLGVRSAIGATSKEKAIVNRFITQSKGANQAFQTGMEDLAAQLGTKYHQGPVKTVERTLEKAKADYNGDLSKVMDTIRGTMELDDPRKAEEIIQAVGGRNKILRVKNGYEVAGPGYKDIKINIRNPNGSVSEVILATPEMLAAKNELGGHALYQQARTSVDSGELARLNEQMNKLYADAEERLSRRLSSAGASTSTPSTNALAGGYGIPVDTTVPRAVNPSSSMRTMVPSTSKNLEGFPSSGIVDGSIQSNVITNPNIVSRGMQAASDDVAVRSFRMSPSQMKNFAQKHGEDVSAFLKRYNAVGMKPDDVESKIVGTLNQKFGDAVRGVTAPIGMDEYIAAVERRAQQLLDSPVPDDNAVGLNLLDTLKEAKTRYPNGFKNGTEMNQFKTAFDRHVNYTMKQADPAKYTVNKHMADAAREVLQEKAPGLKQLGLELSKAYDFADVALQQAQLGRGSGLVRFIPAMAGAMGGAGGGLPGGVIGYAGAQFLNSRMGQSMISNGLQKGANFAARPGVESITGQALKQLASRSLLNGGEIPTDQSLPQDPQAALDQQGSQFDLSYGSPEQQQMVQQLVSMGITNPDDISAVLSGNMGGMGGGDLASQLGGFGGQQGSNPFGYSSADLFGAAIRAMQAGDMKSSDQYIQMAQFAKSYEDTAYQQQQDAMSGGASGLKLTAGSINTMTDLEAGMNDLQGLAAQIQQSDVLSPVGGRLRGLNPYDTGAQSLQAEIDRVRQVVGKALEGGVLRKEDEVKYAKILPTLHDSKEVAMQKLQSVMQALQSKYQQYMYNLNQYSGGSSMYELPSDPSQALNSNYSYGYGY